MKCFICDGEIKNTHNVKLFGYPICTLCFHELGRVSVDSLFYNFYLKKIRAMLHNRYFSNI